MCARVRVGSMCTFSLALKFLKEKKAIESRTSLRSFIAQVYNSRDTSFCKLNLPQISLSSCLCLHKYVNYGIEYHSLLEILLLLNCLDH